MNIGSDTGGKARNKGFAGKWLCRFGLGTRKNFAQGVVGDLWIFSLSLAATLSVSA
jgi:hypothetical protein